MGHIPSLYTQPTPFVNTRTSDNRRYVTNTSISHRSVRVGAGSRGSRGNPLSPQVCDRHAEKHGIPTTRKPRNKERTNNEKGRKHDALNTLRSPALHKRESNEDLEKTTS